jgi:hypothetical protein
VRHGFKETKGVRAYYRHFASIATSDFWYDNREMSLAEIKTAIEQLSFEERAQLAAWMHGWKDDEWDEQMKRDVANGKLDDVLREVEDDIRAGRLRDMP